MAVIACVSLAACPVATRASEGIEPIATSVQALARGGADVAVGDSTLSQIGNPATLTLMPRSGTRVDGLTEVAFLDVLWRRPLRSADTDRPMDFLGGSGLSHPINDRLTLGAAIHSKTALSLPLNVAYKVNDKLSVGGGARLVFVAAELETVVGPAAVDFGTGETLGGGFQFGLLFRPRKDLTFGLGYRSPTWLGALEGGPGKASLPGLLSVPMGRVRVDDVRLPQRVSVGAAWDITKRLKLTSEARWSNFRASSLYETTAQIEGLFDLRLPLRLGYDDVWAFMAGPQYRLSEHWKVACGYHYSTPAVPPRDLLAVGSAPSRHHATTGIWYEPDRWWAGVAYAITFPETLRGDESSWIPGIGHRSVRHMQQAIAVGFGYRW
jgi:long-subunit fatty acid transport protein